MKNQIPFHHNASKSTKQFAKELRQRQTSAEELFWKMVRNRRMLGLKIRRQHPIGKYIVDFYCHELLLVIELDGSIHDVKEVKERDIKREAFLKERGLQVLRFKNDDIFCNSDLIEDQLIRHKDLFLRTGNRRIKLITK